MTPAAPRPTPTGSPDGSPSVSVVLATRDRPQLLRRAVQAVLDQDYAGDVECVVVFDRSEPSPLDVTEQPGRTIRTVVNGRSPGLAGSRNTGYGLATGDLLAACDDDDEWLPGKLGAQVDLLLARPDALLSATGIVVRFEGRDTPRPVPAPQLDFVDFLRDRHTEVHPSTFLARRTDVLERIGLVDEEIPGGYAEDYEWLLRAARLGPVVSVTRPLVRIHWHDSSFFASRWDTIDAALTYLVRRYPEFHDEPRGLARIEGQLAFAHAARGDRRQAWRWARQAIDRHAGQRQAWAAIAVAAGVISSERVVGLGRRMGRGV